MVKLELSVDEANWVLGALLAEASGLRNQAAKAHRDGLHSLSEWWDERAEVVDHVVERLQAEVGE